MVTDPILIIVGVVQLESHVLQYLDRFEDGDAVLPASPEVIDLPTARRTAEVQKQLHHIAGMDLVAHLLALVAKDRIRPPGDSAHDNIGEIPVQLDRGVLRTREAATAKDANRHLEVASELLAHHVSRYLRGAEEGMEALVDGHRFADTVQAMGVVIPHIPFHQRQGVRAVAIDLIGTGEAEWCIPAEVAGSHQQVHGTDGIHIKVVVWN